MSDIEPSFAKRFRRIGRSPFVLPPLFCLVFALLMDVPWLDATSGRGSYFGQFLGVTWCAGMMVWALRITRRRRSQFSLKAMLLGSAAVAVAFGAGRIYGGHVVFWALAMVVSCAMVYDGWQLQEAAIEIGMPYRRRAVFDFQIFAGLLMAAHMLRIFVNLSLQQSGWLGSPGMN
jgi:hypothetical protein